MGDHLPGVERGMTHSFFTLALPGTSRSGDERRPHWCAPLDTNCHGMSGARIQPWT